MFDLEQWLEEVISSLTNPNAWLTALALLVIAVVSAFVYEITLKRVLPFLQQRDWLHLVASAIFGTTILGVFLALLKAVQLSVVAQQIPDSETGELWQAVGALAQVPLLAAASYALYRWTVQRKLGPEIVVGVFPPTTRRIEAELTNTLPLVAEQTWHSTENPRSDIGFKIMVMNRGEKALEYPKIQISSVLPKFKDEVLNGKFRQVPIHIREVHGFHHDEATGRSHFQEEGEFILVGSQTDILRPTEIYAVKCAIANWESPDGYATLVEVPFELAFIRVRVWGANLESSVDQYIVVAHKNLNVEIGRLATEQVKRQQFSLILHTDEVTEASSTVLAPKTQETTGKTERPNPQ